MEQEIWKPVEGYEGIYEVSNMGNIKSLPRRGRRVGMILKPTDNGAGYAVVQLRKDGQRKVHLVHRLVLQAFNPVDAYYEVNHKNFDKYDNKLDNLEWVTPKENVDHFWDNGVPNIVNYGTEHHLSKFTEEEVIYFREAYSKGVVSIQEIADATDSSYETIRMIVKGITWKHLLSS